MRLYLRQVICSHMTLLGFSGVPVLGGEDWVRLGRGRGRGSSATLQMSHGLGSFPLVAPRRWLLLGGKSSSLAASRTPWRRVRLHGGRLTSGR